MMRLMMRRLSYYLVAPRELDARKERDARESSIERVFSDRTFRFISVSDDDDSVHRT